MTGFWLTRFMKALDDSGRQRVLSDVMKLLVEGVFQPRAGNSGLSNGRDLYLLLL